ncbi:Putative fatty-acid--CoA ligase FadD21 [Dyadobacter sp. CECT 9275]|uniref:Fatty-acid--CoA ligase FadD21 n=1 Tax=Dyadobacter helix TaxID=2822344 RepID=A0A916JHP7_9BACT|nr:fatty acyl-AMP ligase [Dyadobacter sp. CECT 9275]CAG5008214.1 Putative fatty-acid--CoA ligase FadD21 [Dyadobacter sp. CECT 9275]
MFILDKLKNYADKYPDKIVYGYVSKEETLSEQVTYKQLWEEVSSLAPQLRERYTATARVIILLPTESSFIKTFLACLHAGLVAVPCPIGFSESGITRVLNIIRDCDASGIITNQKTHKMLFQRQTSASKTLGDYEIDWLFTENLNPVFPVHETEEISINENLPAYLQYTSGSTSLPKGVMISHANLMANLNAINIWFGRTADDTSVTWLPHYHDMGLVDGLLSPLYTGGTGMVIPPLFFIGKPYLWLGTISRYKAGFTGGPGFGIDHCVARIPQDQLSQLDLSSLKVLYVGAEPIRASSLEQFAETMKPTGFNAGSLVPAYGLAEATLAISLDFPGRPVEYKTIANDTTKKIVGCGPLVEKTEVVIVNPETKIIVKESENGEIWATGDSIAQGYWNNPAATKEIFGAYTDSGEGPFLRTGDLGFMSEGRLFITGRLKELIIIRGVNYYPQDIEEVVSQSHEEIQPNATAAFSVETDQGEALMIVSEVRRTSQNSDEFENIKLKIAHQVGIAFGLIPHEIMLIQTGKLPKTSSGKIQRLKAREIFAS